jgi:hypothetical protein
MHNLTRFVSCGSIIPFFFSGFLQIKHKVLSPSLPPHPPKFRAKKVLKKKINRVQKFTHQKMLV